MKIANKSVLITGANRGIGRALMNEALVRGAERVYAGVRGGLEIADPRVTPVTLDVTNAAQIARAAQEIERKGPMNPGCPDGSKQEAAGDRPRGGHDASTHR